MISFSKDILINKFKFIEDYFYLGLSSIVVLISNILILKKSILIFGIEISGVIHLAFVYLTVISLVIDFGFNITATKDIIAVNTIKEQSRILFTTIYSKFLLFCISLILVPIILIYNRHIPHFGFVFLLGLFIPFSQVFHLLWFCQALKRIKVYSIGIIISRVSLLGLVFLFPINSFPYLINFSIGFFALLNFLGLLVLFFKENFIELFSEVKNIEFVKIFKVNIQYFTPNIIVYISSNIGIIVLSRFADPSMLGLYSVGDRVLNSIKQILIIYSGVFIPNCFRFLHNKEERLKKKLIFEHSLFLIVIAFVSIVCFVFSNDIIYYFMNTYSEEGIFNLKIISVIVFAIALNIPFYNILLYYKKSTLVISIFLIGLVVLVLSAFYSINSMHSYSIFISLLISESVMTTLFIIAVQKEYKIWQKLVKSQ